MEVVLEGFSAIWEQNEIKTPVKRVDHRFSFLFHVNLGPTSQQ